MYIASTGNGISRRGFFSAPGRNVIKNSTRTFSAASGPQPYFFPLPPPAHKHQKLQLQKSPFFFFYDWTRQKIFYGESEWVTEWLRVDVRICQNASPFGQQWQKPRIMLFFPSFLLLVQIYLPKIPLFRDSMHAQGFAGNLLNGWWPFEFLNFKYIFLWESGDMQWNWLFDNGTGIMNASDRRPPVFPRPFARYELDRRRRSDWLQ